MRIHLSALGCRLNEAELERWASDFQRAGEQIANDAGDADVVVMNTCAVTREAVRKSRQKLQRLQRNNPAAKLVVSGCYSELANTGALADMGVDLVVPNARKDQLVSLTRAAFKDPAMPAHTTAPASAALFRRNRHRAFIKIQDGCRYRCSFCIVTVARGAERSRSIAELVAEVQEHGNAGIQEVVLTGVHVGGYGSDLNCTLAQLVAALLEHTDMPRIRFASVEPWDLSPEFLQLFANPRIQPHMHLPLQSGSDSVLRRMARRCKTTEFARLTERLREQVPGFNVTTDIITGFPGETEAEWAESMNFIATQQFGHVHVFTYSEREGTRAASLPDPVPVPVRQTRSRELHALAASMKAACCQRLLTTGELTSVLWEGGRALDAAPAGAAGARQYSGYTPNYHRVRTISHADLANRILPTRLDGADDQSLTGQPVLHQAGLPASA